MKNQENLNVCRYINLYLSDLRQEYNAIQVVVVDVTLEYNTIHVHIHTRISLKYTLYVKGFLNAS